MQLLCLSESIWFTELLADDDNSKLLSQSPLLDSQISEMLKKIPSVIRELYESLGPLYEILQTYEILNSDESIYYGQVVNKKKHGTGIEIWPQLGNILDG